MKLPDFPPRIQIEVTNFCNAGCTMCPMPKMKRKRGYMDFGLFEKIIDELEEINFSGYISPFLNGEPLLVPNAIDYLELIKQKIPKAIVNLDTNASKLNEEIGKEIIKNELLDTLTISFDGGTKWAYESIRKGLSFENVRRNVHRFIEMRNEMGKKKPKVIITMVLNPFNIHTKEDLQREFKRADRINFSCLFNWAGQLQKDVPRSKRMKNNFCPRMRQYLTILVNGDVTLCCFDYEGKEIVGNVKTNSIQEIWLGDEYQKRRAYLKKREFSRLPLCSNCDAIDHNFVVQWLIKIDSRVSIRYPKISEIGRDLYKRLVAPIHTSKLK